MKEIVYQVTNPMGVHARPCALLAQCCVNFKSIVTVAANGKVADGRNVLELLALRVKVGDTLTMQVKGEKKTRVKEREPIIRTSIILHLIWGRRP